MNMAEGATNDVPSLLQAGQDPIDRSNISAPSQPTSAPPLVLVKEEDTVMAEAVVWRLVDY